LPTLHRNGLFGLPDTWKTQSVKAIASAAFGLSLVWLFPLHPADAQGQAPIGHRQPNAAVVPPDDSVRGDPALAGAAAPAVPSRKKSARTRRVRSNVDVIMKTPNICSNCNQ
jgi:hypothetical protein